VEQADERVRQVEAAGCQPHQTVEDICLTYILPDESLAHSVSEVIQVREPEA
jgi:hypothetical protein